MALTSQTKRSIIILLFKLRPCFFTHHPLNERATGAFDLLSIPHYYLVANTTKLMPYLMISRIPCSINPCFCSFCVFYPETWRHTCFFLGHYLPRFLLISKDHRVPDWLLAPTWNINLVPVFPQFNHRECQGLYCRIISQFKGHYLARLYLTQIVFCLTVFQK